MEHKSELYQERQWHFYRHSVAEGMPDSEYKTAVLAGIEHTLMRLDSHEGEPNDRPFGLREIRQIRR